MIRTSSTFEEMAGSAGLHIQGVLMQRPRGPLQVPVMRETLLLVELEAQEFCVDLRALSQRILSDLGATMQVFRLAGREFGRNEQRPKRLEDCVAGMGVQACIDAMSMRVSPLGRRSSAIVELWRHARKIARRSQHIALQSRSFDADQAYLVGLCHSIGSLPMVLGWRGHDSAATGVELAEEWLLPDCVAGYFDALESASGKSPWMGIVEAAHAFGGEGAGASEFGGSAAPQLRWAV